MPELDQPGHVIAEQALCEVDAAVDTGRDTCGRDVLREGAQA
jgi:hypothetical protein